MQRSAPVLASFPNSECHRRLQRRVVEESSRWPVPPHPPPVSYSTSQRIKEIGIRLALGAEPSDMWRMVARNGGVLALFGVGIGLCGFLAFAQVLSGIAFGISTRDATTVAVTSVVVMGCAIVASAIPAVRASRVDVVDALRAE